MITPGETWISYMGVPDEYPDSLGLAFEVNDAMWSAALDVLNEHLAADPVLRAMRDDRYRLWEQVDVRVGDLPPGIRIEYRSHGGHSTGVIVPAQESRHPHIYAAVEWDDDFRDTWHPARYTLSLNAVVQAWLPVPFDVSALIAIVAAEAGQDVTCPPRKPRPRPAVDWSRYDACARPGCYAGAGVACCDIRSAWSNRRRSRQPHAGRPRLTQTVAARPDTGAPGGA